MKTAKKYVMVDARQYERLKERSENERTTKPSDILAHPNVKAATADHDLLKEITLDNTLSDYDRVIRYDQVLQRFLKNYKNAVKLSRKDAILGQRESSIKEPLPEVQPNSPPLIAKDDAIDGEEPERQKSETSERRGELDVKSVIRNIPGSYRPRASRLLNSLVTTGKVSWDSEGTVLVNDAPVKGSNIARVARDLVASGRAESSTATLRSLGEVLRAAGVSGKDIKNDATRRSVFGVQKGGGKGVALRGPRASQPFASSLKRPWISY